MIILSHRGYWQNDEEKNTFAAFERSFKLGFGTETDVRDFNGELIISHDIPQKNSEHLTLSNFFEIYKSYYSNLPLALNIKADGLQSELLKLIDRYEIENYFVFDMSVPDGLGYLKRNMNVFTRCSEYETTPSYYDIAQGVWIDEFNSHWVDKTLLDRFTQNKKLVCIVSPELHNRSYLDEWNDYLNIQKEIINNDMMICTDIPEKAKLFFNEN